MPEVSNAAEAVADLAAPEEGAARPVLVYGEPLLNLPQDLYIPPDALEVMLAAFEGPLDLLLYLIRKANINVLDIPMAPLTAQYLSYVDAMRTTNLELAAEYLVMAAMLIEIKSRMLLPRHVAVEGEAVEDPRAELVRRLIEYEQMKLAGQRLDVAEQAGRDFVWAEVLVEKTLQQRLPEVSVEDLQRAWLGILRQAKLNQHHQIRREELSVREHMSRILRLLRGETGFVEFITLFEGQHSAPVLVVCFLAVLELAREKMLVITQSEALSPIYVRLSILPANTPGQSALLETEGEGE